MPARVWSTAFRLCAAQAKACTPNIEMGRIEFVLIRGVRGYLFSATDFTDYTKEPTYFGCPRVYQGAGNARWRISRSFSRVARDFWEEASLNTCLAPVTGY